MFWYTSEASNIKILCIFTSLVTKRSWFVFNIIIFTISRYEVARYRRDKSRIHSNSYHPVLGWDPEMIPLRYAHLIISNPFLLQLQWQTKKLRDCWCVSETELGFAPFQPVPGIRKSSNTGGHGLSSATEERPWRGVSLFAESLGNYSKLDRKPMFYADSASIKGPWEIT